MRIAVNTRLLVKDKLEGIGFFAFETLKRITQQHPEHHFYFIFDRPYDKSFLFSDNITPIVTYPQARHPYLWYLFFEFGVPYQLRKIKPDLFISPDGWIPLHIKIPIVNVIHDLNFEKNPEFIKPTPLRYYKRFFHRFAEKSTQLATVSEYSKKDIHKIYHIPYEKIDIVYSGCKSHFQPATPEGKHKTRQEESNGNPYFLFVGLIHKRKNLDNIFRAFDKFKETDNTGTQLVVVGQKKWWGGDIEDAYNAMQHKDDVIFKGRIDTDRLSRITSGAEAILYPSLFEGFGVPILEGFHAEIPVMTSNVTSMPEVGGDAAYYVNPLSVDEIAEGMHQLINNENLRKELVERGKIQRQKFSWDLTAKLLWESTEKVITQIQNRAK